MIKRIITVEKSKDGSRTYATDLKGQPMFGRTDATTAMLKAGSYANVVEQVQTKTTDEKGELVDLPLNEQRTLQIVTAVWDTKTAAIEVAAEDQMFDLETRAYVQSQTKVISNQYKLDAATVA